MISEDKKFAHFCDDQHNKVFAIYSIKEKLTTRFDVPYETSYLFSFVQINNSLYFTGGGMTDSKTHIEHFLDIAISSQDETTNDDMSDPKKLTSMNVARASHTVVALNGKRIYAIGGLNETGKLTDCEEYSIEENK